MEGINLSSTASLGPEGIWAGNTTEHAPPTDLVQLSEQLNWMRQDLRRIELAFSSVYALKQACEKDLASLQARLDMGLKQSNDAVAQVGSDSQAALAEARSALDANRERLEGLTSKQQSTTERLSATQTHIYERLAEVESSLGGIANAFTGQISELGTASANETESIHQVIRAMRADLGAQQAIIGQAVEQSRNQILETIEVQRLALNVKLTEFWATQSAQAQELAQGLSKATADGDFAIRRDMALMFGRIEADLWPMLWASFKNSLKRLFRREQKT